MKSDARELLNSCTFPTKTQAGILAGKTGTIPNKTIGDLFDLICLKYLQQEKVKQWKVLSINKFKRASTTNAYLKMFASISIPLPILLTNLLEAVFF